MRINSEWIYKTIVLILIFMIIRTIIRGLTWYYFEVFNMISYSFTDYMAHALFFNMYEIPGVITFIFLFVVLQFFIKKIVGLNLGRQVLIVLIIVLLISRLWYLYDLKFLLNANKHSWSEIWQAQIGTGFQFVTFVLFSILFAVLQYQLIEQKTETNS